MPSAAHQKQNPNSDHNTGLAVDLTHDPKHGIDCAEIFEKLKEDKRVDYLIFNGSSSALTRATDSDAWDELVGSLVYVDQGSTQGEYRFYCTSNSGGTLGSTAVVYVRDLSGTLTNSNFVFEVTPSGTIDGSNTAFTLPDTPTAGTLRLHLNGMRLKSGAGNDYTISTNTITMATAPISGDILLCDYMK